MTDERALQIIAELLKRTPLNVAEVTAAEMAVAHLQGRLAALTTPAPEPQAN